MKDRSYIFIDFIVKLPFLIWSYENANINIYNFIFKIFSIFIIVTLFIL